MFVGEMLVKSVGLAALNATVNPGVLAGWVSDIEGYVAEKGKFTKLQVAYIPFSPPPVFWDYKCRKCRFWVDPNACTVVEGDISPRGWCAIWLPPTTYQPFTWPKELIKGDW